MKWYCPALCLAVFSSTICAQQADPCAALAGAALDRCQVNQRQLQQQLTQQQQELTQLQQQLVQQQQQLARQQEQLKQQQAQLAEQQQQTAKQKSANQPAQPATTDYSKLPEVKSWRTENPWFGSDYAKTQFAVRYAKQLQQERPDLVGRPFLDAISAKVSDTFGASK